MKQTQAIGRILVSASLALLTPPAFFWLYTQHINPEPDWSSLRIARDRVQDRLTKKEYASSEEERLLKAQRDNAVHAYLTTRNTYRNALLMHGLCTAASLILGGTVCIGVGWIVIGSGLLPGGILLTAATILATMA